MQVEVMRGARHLALLGALSICCAFSLLRLNSTSTNTPEFCDHSEGKWLRDPAQVEQRYNEDCPFHRNAWNCGRNSRPFMSAMSAWRWVPDRCTLPMVQPSAFLSAMRNSRIGFVGDSLNENFLVSMLCILRAADPGARKWKRKGAWRGGYFPSFNVTIAYHRAVLLAEYIELTGSELSTAPLKGLGLKKAYRVNTDVPARDWANVLQLYDVLVFNTGHWWNFDKFPADSPLVFYERGAPILPLLGLKEGLSLVLNHMVEYIERNSRPGILRIWRMQSPRHFEGGDWNQNGSCTSNKLLSSRELDSWFNSGVNSEARELNRVIRSALRKSGFYSLNITGMSEYRRDAHPAVWLGRKDAHLVWGQDCMHWCLPGLPDTWVDVLCDMILQFFR